MKLTEPQTSRSRPLVAGGVQELDEQQEAAEERQRSICGCALNHLGQSPETREGPSAEGTTQKKKKSGGLLRRTPPAHTRP